MSKEKSVLLLLETFENLLDDPDASVLIKAKFREKLQQERIFVDDEFIVVDDALGSVQLGQKLEFLADKAASSSIPEFTFTAVFSVDELDLNISHSDLPNDCGLAVKDILTVLFQRICNGFLILMLLLTLNFTLFVNRKERSAIPPMNIANSAQWANHSVHSYRCEDIEGAKNLVFMANLSKPLQQVIELVALENITVSAKEEEEEEGVDSRDLTELLAVLPPVIKGPGYMVQQDSPEALIEIVYDLKFNQRESAYGNLTILFALAGSGGGSGGGGGGEEEAAHPWKHYAEACLAVLYTEDVVVYVPSRKQYAMSSDLQLQASFQRYAYYYDASYPWLARQPASDAVAQFLLGWLNLLEYPRMVSLNTFTDTWTYHYMSLAAEAGLVHAQYFLVHCEYALLWSHEPILKHLRIAAKRGHPAAAYSLAVLHKTGDFGLEHSVEKAIGYYRDALQGGHAQAAYELASLYQEGVHVAYDMRTARMYYETAYSLGSAEAAYVLLLSNDKRNTDSGR